MAISSASLTRDVKWSEEANGFAQRIWSLSNWLWHCLSKTDISSPVYVLKTIGTIIGNLHPGVRSASLSAASSSPKKWHRLSALILSRFCSSRQRSHFRSARMLSLTSASSNHQGTCPVDGVIHTSSIRLGSLCSSASLVGRGLGKGIPQEGSYNTSKRSQ